MNRKFTYLYFALASVAAVAFRFFLLFFSTDSDSGFIKDGYKELSIFMFVLILLGLCLIFVFALKAKAKELINPNCTSLTGKIVSFLFAVSILLEVLLSPLAKNLSPMVRTFEIVLGFLSFGVLICSAFANELKIKVHPLFNVVILLFFIVRLIAVFLIFSAFSMILDVVFELLALCAMLIGFLFFAKCKNLSPEELNCPLAFASLLSSCALGFTASVPKLLLTLTGNSAYIHIKISPMYSVFFASVFLLVFTLEAFRFNENEK